MQGKIESLNAAVAGSILLFAAAQQRPAAVQEPPAAALVGDEAEAKPKRKAPTRKSGTKAKSAAEPAKPKKTTIRKVSADLLDRSPSDGELLPGD
jgi:hypothetical protein